MMLAYLRRTQRRLLPRMSRRISLKPPRQGVAQLSLVSKAHGLRQPLRCCLHVCTRRPAPTHPAVHGSSAPVCCLPRSVPLSHGSSRGWRAGDHLRREYCPGQLNTTPCQCQWHFPQVRHSAFGALPQLTRSPDVLLLKWGSPFIETKDGAPDAFLVWSNVRA